MKRISVAALIILLCAPLGAQSIDIIGRRTDPGSVAYRMGLLFDDAELILNELNNDRRLSLSFTIRLYRETEGFLSLFGDTVLDGAALERTLAQDYISGQYIIEENGTLTYYTNSAEFMDAATTWYGTLSARKSELLKEGGYLKGRCIIEYNVLEPPLKVMDFFFPDRNTVLQWVTFSLDDENARK